MLLSCVSKFKIYCCGSFIRLLGASQLILTTGYSFKKYQVKKHYCLTAPTAGGLTDTKLDKNNTLAFFC